MSLVETDIFGTTEDLVAQSIALIKEHEPEDGYYVCFSGGKDSIVVLDLVRKAGVKHDVHMNLTSVDPPELLKFIRQYYPECQMHRPEKSMFQLILKNGIPPTRLARYCCRLLKEGGGRDMDCVVLGVRWEESAQRKQRKVYEKDRKSKKTYILSPIINWASDEIWEYIHANKLPYPSLYDEGFYRIGCIGCPMSGKNRNKEFQRWPQFKKAYYNTLTKLLEVRKANGKDDTHGHWRNIETLWAWWMEELPKDSKNQVRMFE